MAHQIQNEKFTGPISILYTMIEERKLSINDFAIVSITEDFIRYVKQLDTSLFLKDEISQFISVASVLILLKSKSLLPELYLTEEENRDILILENQLKAFELLKTQQKILAKKWQKKGEIFFPGKVQHKNTNKIFVPDPKMQLGYFQSYILGRLDEIAPKEEVKNEVKVHKTLKIEDALSHVRQIIKRIKTLNFANLNDHGDERLRERNKRNVVILFLAVLELVKIGEIDAEQEGDFSDILVQDLAV